MFGLGLGYQISQHLRVNVEGSSTVFDSTEVSATGSVGLQYTFS